MTTLASLETGNPNDADRDIALLDLDTEYSSYHRNEPLPAEFPDDTIEFAASDDFLGMLQQLVSDYGLPSGTAERFKRHHDDASNVPETEELRYTAAWMLKWCPRLRATWQQLARVSACCSLPLWTDQRRWRPNLLTAPALLLQRVRRHYVRSLGGLKTCLSLNSTLTHFDAKTRT